MKYRKKPVVIDAIQWTGNNVEELKSFALSSSCKIIFNGDVYIETLEGLMFVTINDWVIKGIKNELYPCKPDIFDATYELVEPSTRIGTSQGSSRISSIGYKEIVPEVPLSVFKDSIEISDEKAYKPSCVEDDCWWECVKCGANSTSPFGEHKVTFRGPVCDGVVTKRSSIRRTPIKDLGTIEFSDGLDD